MPLISVHPKDVHLAEQIAVRLSKEAGRLTSIAFKHHLAENHIHHTEHDDEKSVPPGHRFFRL